MGYSSLSGHGSTDLNNPIAQKICDICGFRYNGNRLNWQHQWAGNDVINLRLLACPECLDTPQEQLRSIVLPPDPIPTKDPRLEPFAQDAIGGNLAGSNPLVPNVPGGNAITNWDQNGGQWDASGNQWDLTVPD